MKAILGTAFAAVLLCSGAAANAQTKTHSESVTKQRRPGPDTKIKTFDLGDQVRVKGAISPGERVKVEYTKANDGAKRAVILSELLAKAAAESKTSKKY